MYPVLHRLERAGLLDHEWSEASGRRRKLYRLTASGSAKLVEQRQGWREFVGAVDRSSGGTHGRRQPDRPVPRCLRHARPRPRDRRELVDEVADHLLSAAETGSKRSAIDTRRRRAASTRHASANPPSWPPSSPQSHRKETSCPCSSLAISAPSPRSRRRCGSLAAVAAFSASPRATAAGRQERYFVAATMIAALAVLATTAVLIGINLRATGAVRRARRSRSPRSVVAALWRRDCCAWVVGMWIPLLAGGGDLDHAPGVAHARRLRPFAVALPWRCPSSLISPSIAMGSRCTACVTSTPRSARLGALRRDGRCWLRGSWTWPCGSSGASPTRSRHRLTLAPTGPATSVAGPLGARPLLPNLTEE